MNADNLLPTPEPGSASADVVLSGENERGVQRYQYTVGYRDLAGMYYIWDRRSGYRSESAASAAMEKAYKRMAQAVPNA